MTRSVNIEVYCDTTPDGDCEVFAVATEHRTDLPKPFDDQLQRWARQDFSDLENGDSIINAGSLMYEPNNKIVRIERS
jgi:hypothetical protein